MLTVKEWMELIDYKITEGDTYGWTCYGADAYSISSWNGIHGKGGFSSNIIFDTRTQEVYEVDFCDYTNERAYRLINENFKKQYLKEADDRECSPDEAWDCVTYVDLESDDDFMQKALSIKAGEDYDTRVSIPLDIPEDELMVLFKMAHERDMTFNQLVEEALKETLKDWERDPERFKELTKKYDDKQF